MAEALDWLADASEAERDRLADWLEAGRGEGREFDYHWRFWARSAQLAPDGDWTVWLVLAGRGFGKTRAGAEWVRSIAEGDPRARIALVSSSLAEARAVMIEGESGLIACSPPGRAPTFEPSLKRLRYPGGAQVFLYGAAEPESLRGPQHSHAWCDEIGKWPLAHERATRCWDNLLLGLRLGRDRRIVATTTPRNVPLVRRLLGDADKGKTVVTHGTSQANAGNLPRGFLAGMEEEFGASRIGRQELAGEMVEDVDGALWTRALIEAACIQEADALFVRTVIGVDPPATARGDACGIIVAALDENGTAHVLADCSCEQASPERWAGAVAAAASDFAADRVIAEANQGGDMVASVLRAADHSMPVRLVRASRGKVARAEPVAALYEAGRVRHAGRFPALEDEMCGLLPGGAYEGPGRSPDRADALVWALSELMLGPAARPRVLRV